VKALRKKISQRYGFAACRVSAEGIIKDPGVESADGKAMNRRGRVGGMPANDLSRMTAGSIVPFASILRKSSTQKKDIDMHVDETDDLSIARWR
jgi:hypothetical protein